MDSRDILAQRFRQAFDAAHLTVDELWLRYFALGGIAGRFEIEAYLSGALALPPSEHDMVAHAINERLDELTPPRAPYSHEIQAAELVDQADAETDE